MAIIGNTPRPNTCQSQPIKADYGRASYTPRVVFLYAGLRFCVHRYSKVDPLTENPSKRLSIKSVVDSLPSPSIPRIFRQSLLKASWNVRKVCLGKS